MSRHKVTKELRLVPLDLVNDPKFLRRENMGSQEELEELIKSLRVSQIEPIVVFAVDGRYELIAGHRRVYAARLGGIQALWADIVSGTIEDLSIMRFQENKQRLQASAYEEAVFLAEMLENLKCTQVELANKLGLSAAYVAQRLAILKGYEPIREALRAGLINFAQCRELMLYPDQPSAVRYLEVCITSGATSDLLRRWRVDAEVTYKQLESESEQNVDPEETRKLVQLQMRKCECCNAVVDPVDLKYLKVCGVCHKTLLGAVDGFRK